MLRSVRVHVDATPHLRGTRRSHNRCAAFNFLLDNPANLPFDPRKNSGMRLRAKVAMSNRANKPFVRENRRALFVLVTLNGNATVWKPVRQGKVDSLIAIESMRESCMISLRESNYKLASALDGVVDWYAVIQKNLR
jgi:hypothetical protein